MTEPTIRATQTSTPARNGQATEDLRAINQPASNGDVRAESERESPPGVPRWVKVFAIVSVVLVLLFAGLHLSGNAPTHMPASGTAEHGMPMP